MPDRPVAERSSPESPLDTPRPITPSELADELESGHWHKARGQLGKGSNSRCCLGVACEMVGIDFIPTHGTPPESIRPWAPWLPPVESSLIMLNDATPGWGMVVRRLRSMNIGDAEASSATSGEAGP